MRGDERQSRIAAPADAGRALTSVLATTLLAVIVVLVASWVVWQQVSERHQRDLAEQFAGESAEITVRIEERFRGYRQVLRGGRALFAASDAVGNEQWHDYVRELKLEQDYPGIQGVGFTQWILPELLERHHQEKHAQGYTNYRVWPAAPRAAYTAIVMLEPFDWRNRRAFGFDMYSEPVRREAMARAVRTGSEALSGKVTLVQETTSNQQAGVLLYLPVFANGAPTSTEEERWQALMGWVYSPFRMNDLMEGMLERYSGNVRLRVFDQEEGPDRLLYDSHPGRSPANDPGITQLRALELDGRDWLLVLDALPGFEPVADGSQMELIAVGLIGLLLVGVTWSFASTRQRARALARASESLRRSETRYATLVNLAHEGIAATDEEFRLTFVNPRLSEMLGAPPAALEGQPMEAFWAGAAPESRHRMLSRLQRGVGSRYEVEMRRSDGSTLTALISDAALCDEGGRVKGAILMITDISERKAAERRIEHLATHDALTGVPNRQMLTDLLRQTMGLSRRFHHNFALLFIDLDRFKAVNDAYGHLVGDRVLVESARRMQACLRTSDTLSRQGGDEFVVLLPEIESPHDAEVVAEKIRAAMAVAFSIDGRELYISSSIGIALYPQHGVDEDSLLRNADDAMYLAKAEGRNCTRSPAG